MYDLQELLISGVIGFVIGLAVAIGFILGVRFEK